MGLGENVELFDNTTIRTEENEFTLNRINMKLDLEINQYVFAMI